MGNTLSQYSTSGSLITQFGSNGTGNGHFGQWGSDGIAIGNR